MSVIESLLAQLDATIVDRSLDACESARADRSGKVSASAPVAVVRPRSTDDVATVLRLANAAGVSVVPRGAGTGLAGGALADADSICLDLTAMNEIIDLNPQERTARVQPGVINGDLNDAVAVLGLMYAPDPASRAISSIGGNIATNAGGLICVKYGVTRDAVLGLEAVLADGSVIRTGRNTVKGVTGYDLTALITGSEGTLAVITEATVRLTVLPAMPPVTLLATFDDVVAAARAAGNVIAAGLQPSMLELLDASVVRAVRAHFAGDAHFTELDGIGDNAAVLVAQADGPGADDEAQRIADVLTRAQGRVQVSDSVESGERLIEVRRAVHWALDQFGTVLIEDVSVPRTRLGDMFTAIADISQRYGIDIPTLAHAGDGNLHPNFVYEGGEVPEHIWNAADEVFTTALAFGGTLTGEHGVGVLKRRWLKQELGARQYVLQRSIKAAFDPNNILNPQVMFAPET